MTVERSDIIRMKKLTVNIFLRVTRPLLAIKTNDMIQVCKIAASLRHQGVYHKIFCRYLHYDYGDVQMTFIMLTGPFWL
jgi:hypothetical protein